MECWNERPMGSSPLVSCKGQNKLIGWWGSYSMCLLALIGEGITYKSWKSISQFPQFQWELIDLKCLPLFLSPQLLTDFLISPVYPAIFVLILNFQQLQYFTFKFNHLLIMPCIHSCWTLMFCASGWNVPLPHGVQPNIFSSESITAEWIRLSKQGHCAFENIKKNSFWQTSSWFP